MENEIVKPVRGEVFRAPFGEPYIDRKVVNLVVDIPKASLRDKLMTAFRLAEARLNPHGPFCSNAEIEKEIAGLLEQK